MSNNSKRFIVLVLTVLVAAVWGFESSYLFGPGPISTLLSIVGGFIIGIIGYELAGKIRD